MGASMVQRASTLVGAAVAPREREEAPADARQALRGLTFEAQEARLAPGGGGPPVQNKEEDPTAAKNATPKDKVPADSAPTTKPEEAAAPGAPAEAEKPLSAQQVMQAMAMYRKNPLPFEAIAAYQKLASLSPTGVIDPDLVQYVAVERGAAAEAAPAPKPKRGRQPKADPTVKARLGVPDVALMKAHGIAVVAANAKAPKAGRSAKGPAPAQDAGCKAVVGMKYNEYVGTLVAGTFLGHGVTVNVELLTRLKAAEAFLASKHPEAGGDMAEVGKRLGVTSVSSFRPSSAKSDQMYHGLGYAIDLNPGTNPWVFGNTGRSTQNAAIPVVLTRAAAFTGKGGSLTASKISTMAGTMSTLDLVAKLESSDASLEEYRKFGKLDKASLEPIIDEKLAKSPAMKALGNKAFWQKKIPFDDLIMTKYIEDQGKNHTGGTENKTGGFMDLKPIVIQAMRDVAGLRWGATDMGPESGDMMHFDGDKTMSNGTTLRKRISEEAKKLAAGAEEKAGSAKDAE